MVILETGIIHHVNLLVKKQFYPSQEFLSDTTRTGLINGVLQLAEQSFHDKLTKITLAGYYILTIVVSIDTNIKEFQNQNHLLLYAITDSESNEKKILTELEAIGNICLNRCSIIDIAKEKPKKFQKFEKRLEKSFDDLALKLEDRFKSLY